MASKSTKTPLVKEGTCLEIEPYESLLYQSTHFEPVCGNLGTGDEYNQPHNYGDKCVAALASFETITDNVAIFSPDGTHNKGGLVGAGYDTCLCFALSNRAVKGGICVWADGEGQAERFVAPDINRLAYVGSYGLVNKSLPSCTFSDVTKLKATWSATAAAMPAITAAGNSTSTGSGNNNTIKIAGGSVGVLLIVIILLIWVCCKCGVCSGDGGDEGGEKVKKKNNYVDSSFGRNGEWLGVQTRQYR